MHTFTLDTNCWIAIEDGRPEAASVRLLAEAQSAGSANVAIVAISASERQKGGHYIKNINEFRERLASLGLGHLDILKPMAYFDVTFWDWCLLTGPEMEVLERRIHDILFPSVQYSWRDYCLANNVDPHSLPSGRWRDVQALWFHIYSKRDVFVTTDPNFHKTKKPALVSLGAG
jgi:hypothetical protein